MPSTLTALVKYVSHLRQDADMLSKPDPEVKLHILGNDGKPVCEAQHTTAKQNCGETAVFNEFLEFKHLPSEACTLRVEVVDKDTFFGLGGAIADALVSDESLGSADVQLSAVLGAPSDHHLDLGHDQSIVVTLKLEEFGPFEPGSRVEYTSKADNSVQNGTVQRNDGIYVVVALDGDQIVTSPMRAAKYVFRAI